MPVLASRDIGSSSRCGVTGGSPLLDQWNRITQRVIIEA
jgi:hypothetical protein